MELQEIGKVVLVVGLRRSERVLAAGFLAGRGQKSEIQSRSANGPHVGGRDVLACRGQRSTTQLRLVVP